MKVEDWFTASRIPFIIYSFELIHKHDLTKKRVLLIERIMVGYGQLNKYQPLLQKQRNKLIANRRRC